MRFLFYRIEIQFPKFVHWHWFTIWSLNTFTPELLISISFSLDADPLSSMLSSCQPQDTNPRLSYQWSLNYRTLSAVIQGLLQYAIIRPKRIFNLNLAKSRLPMTYCPVVKSCWNFTHSAAMSLLNLLKRVEGWNRCYRFPGILLIFHNTGAPSVFVSLTAAEHYNRLWNCEKRTYNSKLV